MNHLDKIEILVKALEFYVNSDNYWPEPGDLDRKHCRDTLRDCNERYGKMPVIKDSGYTAFKALTDIGELNETIPHWRVGNENSGDSTEES
jgi:hypothetical protein